MTCATRHASRSGKYFLLICGLIALSACATKDVKDNKSDAQKRSALDPRNVEVEVDRDKLGKSVQAPLYSLNLKRDKIPTALAEIKVPYAPPVPPTCARVRESLDRIDAVLGPDAGEADTSKNKKFILSTSDALGNAIEGFIPYNSIIKRLSGASKHEKLIATAEFRGHLRRAYLKGWAIRKGCEDIKYKAPPVEKKRQ